MRFSFETDQLLATVEKFYGQSIMDNYDCIRLSSNIYGCTQERVSSQTLRRLYNLITSDTKPTANTLNILSKYIGFEDYTNFCHYLKRQPTDNPNDINSIIKIYKTNKEHHYDRALFHEFISRQLAEFVVRDEKRFTEFTAKMHNQPMAIRYVIESNIFYDLLGKDWFMRGLRLFCRSSNLYHHKLFLNSLEFQSNWLQKNFNNAGKFLIDIEDEINLMRNKFGIIWALEGCLMAERIVWANYNNDKKQIDKLVADTKALINENIDFVFENEMNFGSFLITFFDCLNWGGISKIGLEVEIYLGSIDFSLNTLWHKSANQLLTLYTGFMYMQVGEIKSAKKSLHVFDIKNSHISKLKYNCIQYYILQYKFESNKSKKEKLKIKVEELVAETGFIRYLDFL